MSVHLHTHWKPQFGAKYGPRGSTRAIYEAGVGACRDTYCIKKAKAIGATHPMGKINLNKNNLISLGKYTIATDVNCYHTNFSKMNFFYEYQGIKSSKIVP